MAATMGDVSKARRALDGLVEVLERIEREVERRGANSDACLFIIKKIY